MTPFLITGFPRCRTTWLSVVASIPGKSHCEHEPSLKMHGLNDLMAYYRARDEKYVGVSDSFFASGLPAILRFMPMRCLIVTRPIEEVIASLERRGLNPSVLPEMMRGISAVLENSNVKAITFADLRNDYKVAKALNWLMPEAKISREWIKSHQKVQIEADHVANRAAWQQNKIEHELLLRAHP